MNALNATVDGVCPISCFDLLFDRELALYFPEDDVEGNVKITLNKPLRLANLRLIFKGRANYENVPARTGSSTKSSTSELTYFDKEVVLVDRLPGKEDTGEFVLPSGEHLIPYTFPLPKRLLSSYEGKYGSIRYYCQAVISRTGHENYVTERPFTVLSRDCSSSLNGSTSLDLLKPAIHSDSEKVTSCCSSGLISCEVTLPKLIYYPGEAVVASLVVVNDSRSALSKITAKLMQNETCISKLEPNVKVATSSRGVIETELDKRLGGRSKKSWPNEFLFTVPSLPASSESCPILHIAYELQLELVFASRSSQLLIVQVPLQIGSPLDTSTDGDTTDQGAPSRPLLAAKSFKYVQCVFGPNVFEMDSNPSSLNRIEFTPVYPVLNS
uniref:Arrestin_C domain-containing protein n=1 Tax=Trichuris muris TaxID=70415 RepID=A0A5S6R1N7_TRIMR